MIKKFIIILFIVAPTNVLSFDKITNFTFEKFETAQNNNRTIVVNSWNKYCSTCKAQSKIFADAINDFKNVEFLFYEQTKHKDIAEALNIDYWTTIIVFKGKNEIIRTIGLSKKEEVYSAIKKGIYN